MTELVSNGGPPRQPMSVGMRVAMCLELALVTDLLFGLPHWSSVVALVICLPYSWFSATRSAFQYAADDEVHK